MFAAPDEPRAQCVALHEMLGTLTRQDFEARCAARDRAFGDQGITFSLLGEERPFPLDLVPRIMAAGEWAVVERGVRQRVLALERFLADVYGPGEILADGVVPRRLVVTSSHFHRAVAGFEPAGGVRVHVSGVDLVRDESGNFLVLEDNLRTPSGISYVVENRRAMTHVFPELFARHRIRRVSDYPQRLLQVLRAAAPSGVDDPCVVVLTPGVHNAAYFEHSFLARQMGAELVEGPDLVCRDQRLYMRTTSGEQRVDVVYRRIDDEYLDPLHFRPDSVLGCAGILNAARAGNVTIANAPGNGVADDKAVYPYVPAMIEYYLGEAPIIANVETYRLEDAETRAWALERLDSLVFKPVGGSGGYGLVIGPTAGDATLADLRTKVVANPRGWIAQEPVALSTSPTYVDGHMGPRHLDLRPFAVNDGRDVWVVPGGLTRVALPEGSLVVNSSQGGGSKDTWVLAAADDRPEQSPAPAATVGAARGGPAPAPAAGPSGARQAQQQ
ncbi:MAG: circularly permuted type 2 ATP-grasp protein [Acidimicrobiia bacterium]